MNCSGSDAECLGRFEDSGPGRQLHADAIHDITAYGGTPQPFPG
jgi:hypothetical protein